MKEVAAKLLKVPSNIKFLAQDKKAMEPPVYLYESFKSLKGVTCLQQFIQENRYLLLPTIFYEKISPTASVSPKLIILNKQLAQHLNIDPDYLQSEKGLNILSGIDVNNLTPFAQSYMGHQFGHLTMLGDGRAIMLGEINASTERLDIQLKGGGPTQYARGGDGMAAIGPMIREYIISEAMAELNIPTTRSLAVIETGRQVRRHYLERGALVIRLAKSHLRVGTFQFALYYGSKDELKKLANHAIDTLYPYLNQATNPYISLLRTVIKKQAELIAQWQLVGFVHGVMNTDNMTISGETIDYGPCAFIDTYRRDAVFSSIDTQGRYAFDNQPQIGAWNLTRFAETLLPLLDPDDDKAIKIAKEELKKYGTLFEHHWLSGMRKKLGMLNEKSNDLQLIHELLHLMEKEKRDYTETFRALTLNQLDELKLKQSHAFNSWYQKWQKRIETFNNKSYEMMKTVNPAVISRNYLVEEAINHIETHQDTSKMHSLLELIKEPFAYRSDQLAYSLPDDEHGKPYTTYCGT